MTILLLNLRKIRILLKALIGEISLQLKKYKLALKKSKNLQSNFKLSKRNLQELVIVNQV